MRPISHTLIDSIHAPIAEVFALLTDPERMADWLPACNGTSTEGPLQKGARLTVRFGARHTEFEIVDFMPPRTFGWVERGQRRGTKTFFRLDATGPSTAVTIRNVWTPPSVPAWLRGRFLPKRNVPSHLRQTLEGLRSKLGS